MGPEGFRRCDGFAGSVPQNFINANLPVCPLCGSTDPYWTLRDKLEFTAHRVMFRCQHCGGVLSATQDDFTGTTKSTAFAVLTTAGAVNALTKKKQGKDVHTVYMKVEDVGSFQTSTALSGKELPIDDFKAMAASFNAPPAAPAPQPEAAPLEDIRVSYDQPAAAEPVSVQPVPAAPQPVAAAPVTPVEPEQIQVSYAQPEAQPAAAPVQSAAWKFPVAPFILMAIATLYGFINLFLNNYGAAAFLSKLVSFAPLALMLVGMLTCKKQKNVLFAVAFFATALLSFIYLCVNGGGARFGYTRILVAFSVLDYLVNIVASAAIGVCYLVGKPKLKILKLIAAIASLAMSFLFLIVLSSTFHIPFVTQFLIFLVGTATVYVAVILYTPFDK